MNYGKHYFKLIASAQQRQDTDVYTEQHHIIPRCQGGSESEMNKVYLTAREHFVAHWLLAKMFPDNRKIAYAFEMMTKGNTGQDRYYSSKGFEAAKRIQQEFNTGVNNPNARPADVFDLESGIMVAEGVALGKWAPDNGYDYSALHRVAKGERAFHKDVFTVYCDDR